jgi:putative membrane protein
MPFGKATDHPLHEIWGNEEAYMYKRLHVLFFALILSLATLALASCQRSGGTVQAAREPNQPAATEPSNTNAVSGADKDFVLQAEKDNIQQRVLGNMAQEKSQNSAVKEYGKMLVKDDNGALQKLVVVMKKYGLHQPKGLPEERSEAVKEVQGLSGPDFDKKFVSIMIADNQKAISTFRHQAATTQNADVRDYAKNQLSTLEKHLKDAQDLQSKLGSKG